MTTTPRPDFVGRLLGEGAELAVRPLLPSLFDPAPEPSREPAARQRPQRPPDLGSASDRPEAAPPEPAPVRAPRPDQETVARKTTAPQPKAPAAPEPRITLPRREVKPAPLPDLPRPEPKQPTVSQPVRRPERKPAVVTVSSPVKEVTTEERAVEVPVVRQVEKTVVRPEAGTVVPAVAPIAAVAEPPRPVAPRRSRVVEQTVHITIGRVEVKAAAEKAPERRAPARRQPGTSLEDYLHRRGGGSS